MLFRKLYGNIVSSTELYGFVYTILAFQRYTEDEWEKELLKRVKVVLGYMKERYSKKEGMAQVIFVVEDKMDFKIL